MGDGTYEVSGANGFTGDIEIPSTYNGEDVTRIGENAFKNNIGLTSIKIPNSVLSIGNSAFYGCTNLKSVNISGKVTSIGDYAFASCVSITSILIPGSVTSIGKNAFDSCSSLIRISLSERVKNSSLNIGESAFSGCSEMTDIIIPSGGITGNNAFSGCVKLTIFAQDATKPDSWNNGWNSSNRPVFWGCGLGISAQIYYEQIYVKSFTSLSYNPNASGEISVPYRQGYVFDGWFADEGHTISVDIKSAKAGTYYAKWTSTSSAGCTNIKLTDIGTGMIVVLLATTCLVSFLVLKKRKIRYA